MLQSNNIDYLANANSKSLLQQDTIAESRRRSSLLCRPATSAFGFRPPCNAADSWHQQETRFAILIGSQALKRIPIFPLGLVALPTVQVPLNIFEARYRVLFSTLLAGGAGIDELLVQSDSPFLGSKEFGICYLHSQGMAAVGTIVSIQHHEVFEDGRMFIVSEGTQRFNVQNVIQSKPVVIADCELLPEPADDGEDEESKQLADTARELVHAVLQLRQRLNKKPLSADPPELRNLAPRELSYWIASLFLQDLYFQQLLLQAPDTQARLTVASDVLEQISSQLRAMVALESLGQSSPSEESAEAPADSESRSGGEEGPGAEGSPDKGSS